MSHDTMFETFAQGLVPTKPNADPGTIRHAREWYRQFAGRHAVKMDDQELVTIYQDLH
jgi:hypothetical protein